LHATYPNFPTPGWRHTIDMLDTNRATFTECLLYHGDELVIFIDGPASSLSFND